MHTTNEIYLKADKILTLFKDETLKRFNNRIISIFKMGSLGNHGDFSACSDVDVALFLDEITAEDSKNIHEIQDNIIITQLEYADRLSIFWSCYKQNIFSAGLGRFPALDRLDLIEHGTLIYGKDKRENLQKPRHEDIIIESAKFISMYMLTEDKFKILTEQPEKIIEKGARYFSKAILFPVRLIYTIEQPNQIGSNYDAVLYFNKKFNSILKNSIPLINKAYEARQLPSLKPPIDVNISMLKMGLYPLYLFCIEQYVAALNKINSIDINSTIEQLKLEYDRLIKVFNN